MQNAPMEHSAVLLTYIKIPNGFQAFVLSVIEWPLKTGFTAYDKYQNLMSWLIWWNTQLQAV